MELDPAARAALWGFMGAFIYAAPRWIACLVASDAKGRHTLCALELFVALGVGAISAAAFGRLALTTLHIRDENAVCTLLGLLANPASPMIVKRLSNAVSAFVEGRISRTLNEDGK